MTSSINTNISAYFAQANIAAASANASSSVARLSSGNRIVKASDDVAALSTGTSLRTQVTALKTALTNASQGTSLLQVADGALSQVSEILQRQKAIALQAGSGSLTDTDRGFLNQEFQALTSEIDRLTGSANFNGVKLIDGALSQAAKVSSSTTKATAASATLGLSANLVNNETLIINGVTLTAVSSLSPTTAQFTIGATTADTIQNLATKLNALSTDSSTVVVAGGASTTYAAALGGANYSVNGTNSATLNITSRTGGTLGNSFTVKAGAVAAGKVNIGGQYGGAAINLLATNFTSATAAIVSGTSSQSLTVPFKAGDTIKATIGSSASVSLYAVQANDSLTNIVDGINSNSATSGFSAVLVGSGSSYNIELHTRNSSGNISLNGGDNYFTTAATGAQTYALNGATSTVNLLSDTLAATSNGTAVVASAAAPTTPFVNGSNLYISVAGGTKAALLDATGGLLATGDTVASIVTKINNSAAAGALGVSAALSENGTNVVIKYNDPTQTSGSPSAVTFTSGLTSGTQNSYNTDALGQNFGSGLNGAYVTFNLLGSAVATPDTAAVAANSAGTANAPIEAGTDITVAFNTNATTLGSPIIIGNSGNVTAGLTLQQLAGVINADADSLANGIHATVIQDGAGYNIQLQYAASAAPVAGTGGTASTTGVKLTYDNDTVGGTGAYTPVATLNQAKSDHYQGNLFATGFTTGSGGSYVISAGASSNGSSNIPFGSDAVITLRYNGVNVSNAITVGTSATINSLITQINNDTTAQANGISAELVNDGVTANIRIKVSDAANHTGVNPGVADFSVTNATQTNDFTGHAVNTALSASVPTSNYTTYRVFNSTFANTLGGSGVSVVAAASSSNYPFKAGDVLAVKLNGVSSTTLTDALVAGQSLTDIVNNINANTNAGLKTGFSAVVDGSNILLKNVNNFKSAAANATAAFTGGNGFFNNADLVAGIGNHTAGFNNSYSYGNLFTTDIATAGAGGAFVITNGAPATNTPLKNAGTFAVTGLAGNLALGAGTTLQDVVNYVNTDANSQGLGLHADLINTGGNNWNIQLTYADITASGSPHASATVTSALADANMLTTVTQTNVPVDNILQKASTLSAATDNGAVGLVNLGSFGLSGGADNGLGYGSTSVTGTIGDNLLTGLTQNKARSIIAFPDIDAASLTSAGNFGSAGAVALSVGGKSFTFVTAATAADQIEIGATLKETLDNAVSTINSYAANHATGDVAYQLNQVSIARSGNAIVIQGKGISDVTTITGTASAVTLTGFTNGATVSSPNLSNSSRDGAGTFGVDVSGISNVDFTGKISGFTATYAGTANTVNLSVKIGDYTYSANNVNTNPITGNKVIRLLSDQVGSGATASNGGYFDIQLANNTGEMVNPSTSSTDASHYAQRLNAAFNGLAFAQTRQIASYSGTQSITSGSTLVGSLLGSSVAAKLNSYASNKLTNIAVSAPPAGGGDAQIALTIDGKQFVSSALGSQLGANQTYRFTSTTDSSQYVEFHTGNSSIDLSTSVNAKAVQTALGEAFGVSNGAGALSFQIGSTSDDTLAVSIGSATTDSLYDGQTLDVLSQANATIASDQLDKALQSVTTLRASVGALQSRFNFASANIQIGIQNQDAARAEFLDTDVASESTNYANAQVKLQAGISVLAQANQQLQNLLKLIQ